MQQRQIGERGRTCKFSKGAEYWLTSANEGGQEDLQVVRSVIVSVKRGNARGEKGAR